MRCSFAATDSLIGSPPTSGGAAMGAAATGPRASRQRRPGGHRHHDRGRFPRRRLARTQDHAVLLDLRIDPPRHFALGDAMQHLGVGLRRLGAKIPIFRGQIAEIFRNRLHRREGFVEPLQRAREGAVGDG
ncbi:hypothetical protein ACTTAM_15040 [Rhodobacter capsulatus]|uniref:hypothetical protein n=1 Tax=Rhodobacter capsulatus TaxID=1061 RepID=UPI0040260441